VPGRLKGVDPRHVRQHPVDERTADALAEGCGRLPTPLQQRPGQAADFLRLFRVDVFLSFAPQGGVGIPCERLRWSHKHGRRLAVAESRAPSTSIPSTRNGWALALILHVPKANRIAQQARLSEGGSGEMIAGTSQHRGGSSGNWRSAQPTIASWKQINHAGASTKLAPRCRNTTAAISKPLARRYPRS